MGDSQKERIIDVATRLFSSKGFDATSVDEIAKEAGINKAMIYYYFSSKEGLLNSIIRKSVNDFSGIVEKIDFTKYGSLKDFINEIVKLAIDYVDHNTDIVKIFFREGFIYGEKIGTTISETISLVFENVISKVKHRFNILDNISFIDQAIITNLVVGIIDLKNRVLGKIGQEEYLLIREQYINKVSNILYFLATS